ncbi:MAG: PD40 domain-containing protein [Bacteroidetes bacterium]|nr:PD40 domain-containing protein [Bacteroidota bacterium]
MTSIPNFRTVFLILLPAVMLLLSACGGLAPELITEHDGVVAINLGDQVNSTYDEYVTAVDRDRLYITTNRPTHEGYIQGDDIWFTDREGAGWSKALNYGGKINTQRDEGSPFITDNGEDVYFVQCDTEDGLGDCDLYTAKMDYNGKWQEITNLGDRVNSKYWDSQPFISPDGEYLYFASDRSGGHGGADIWRAKRLRSGRWGTPKNLGPEVNTSGDEKAPMLAPNGIDLYFSSTGHPGLGGYDLFRSSNIKDEKWSPAKNVGRPFNTAADDMFWRLTAREDTVFISSSRNGGEGELDIFAVWPNPYKDSTRYIYHVKGVVFDTITEMGLSNARIRVTPSGAAAFTVQASGTGRYQFRTELGRSYEMTAMFEGYHDETVSIEVPDFLYYNEFRKSIGMAPVSQVKPGAADVVVDGETVIRADAEDAVSYFEFDRSELMPEYRTMLKELFDTEIKPMIEADASFTIALDAHTDDRGTEDYNFALSRRRGAAVSRFLRDLGVPLEAIRINAYGENRPVATGESLRAFSLNRRVELRIVTTPN